MCMFAVLLRGRNWVLQLHVLRGPARMSPVNGYLPVGVDLGVHWAEDVNIIV
jgi:hypothetical protein